MKEPIRLALLGDPVAHSRSPAIHAAALAQAGLKGEYKAIRADQAILEGAIRDLRNGILTGLNITMPLKAAAAALADVLTAPARESKSVNTLRSAGGVVEAHSTDVVAFEELLGDERFPGGVPVLVVGSGGSARAALAAMSSRETYVSARSSAKSRDLVAEYGLSGSIPWGEGIVDSLVVNATPLGMRGERLPESIMNSAGSLIDLPYGNHPTPAAEHAETAGLPLADGVEFLVRQARASFFWWTGKVVDFRALVGAARNV